MATIVNQKNKEVFDKENPPHPSPATKKLMPTQEITVKKTVLGDTAQISVAEDQVETDLIGDLLYRRKCQNQRQSKDQTTYALKPIQC